jgi:hypothetical protein
MTFSKKNAALDGFNQWTVNGVAFSMDKMAPMFHIREGKRYRLRMRNASDDIHPIHLHRHSFELTKIAGKPTAGVIKDVVMLGGYQEIEVDFVAVYETDPTHAAGSLCARREWPRRCRAAEQRYELAPLHGLPSCRHSEQAEGIIFGAAPVVHHNKGGRPMSQLGPDSAPPATSAWGLFTLQDSP